VSTPKKASGSIGKTTSSAPDALGSDPHPAAHRIVAGLLVGLDLFCHNVVEVRAAPDPSRRYGEVCSPVVSWLSAWLCYHFRRWCPSLYFLL
jgi:hypothetical protein